MTRVAELGGCGFFGLGEKGEREEGREGMEKGGSSEEAGRDDVSGGKRIPRVELHVLTQKERKERKDGG